MNADGANDVILVLNAGSSSLKFELFTRAADPQSLCRGQIENLRHTPHFLCLRDGGETLAEQTLPPAAHSEAAHQNALAFLLDWLDAHPDFGQVAAVGHRVVHGGDAFTAPLRVTETILAQLELLIPLAPLHQPHNLAAIRAVAAHAPGLPQIACFDTAFHATLPDLARRFAIPESWHERGVRRYGFHGLSYDYISRQLPLHLGAMPERAIIAHLGSGASLCALKNGRSIDTTMGMTALDGLPMGTRCGAIDPGAILYLLDQGLDSAAIAELLYRKSGLLGVSGISDDVRELLASADPAARRALDLFTYRIGRDIGALAASLGGLDALAFTAGIGEHAAPIRAAVCERAAWLGVELDPAASAAGAGRISAPGSAVTVLVIPTDEEWMIAHDTAALTG